MPPTKILCAILALASVPLSYGICHTGRTTVVVVAYASAAGATFQGTLAIFTAPFAALKCNTSYSMYQAAFSAACVTPTP